MWCSFGCCASIRAKILVLTGGGFMVISLKPSDYECFQIVAAMAEKYHRFISVIKLQAFLFSDVVTVVVPFYGNEYKQSNTQRKNKNNKVEIKK
jgi:hypothetical protein